MASILEKVAILHEYDYIQTLPLETLVQQGLSAKKPRLMQKSVLPKDNELITVFWYISMLIKINTLSNYRGSSTIPIRVSDLFI